MSLIIGKNLSIALSAELRDEIQEFADMSGMSSISEVGKALVVRGLYKEKKPHGKFSESAWIAAYHGAKAATMNVLYRMLSGQDFTKLCQKAMKEAMRIAGENILDDSPYT